MGLVVLEGVVLGPVMGLVLEGLVMGLVMVVLGLVVVPP